MEIQIAQCKHFLFEEIFGSIFKTGIECGSLEGAELEPVPFIQKPCEDPI